MTADIDVDVAIVGAGLSGLVCARRLNQRGVRTILLEKSRGVGGRLATRRVEGTPIDHGVRYIEAQGPYTQQLIQQMAAMGILSVVTSSPVLDSALDCHTEARETPPLLYIASPGMTAIAKALAVDLALHRQHRVESLDCRADRWCLGVIAAEESKTITATAVVFAIPAPQILPLLPTLADETLSQLATALTAVTFDPSFTVMVGYQAQSKPSRCLGLRSPTPNLSWVGFEAQKRLMSAPVLVLQSSIELARRAIDTMSLDAIADEMVASAETIEPVAALGAPQWRQIHRWRYGFCRRPHSRPHLALRQPLPLVCCGDWCGGNTIEAAMASGHAAAAAIAAMLP